MADTQSARSRAKKSSAVWLVDGSRTPFIKFRGRPNPLSASDLGVAAGQQLLLRQPFDGSDAVDEVIFGCAGPEPGEANIARIIALRLGLGHATPAWSVQRNCGSGMQAIDSGMQSILRGRSELVVCGGTEAMSRAPLMFEERFVHWLADLQQAKGAASKAATLARFRPSMLKPVIALLRGLTDPVSGMSMGQTAEKLASRFGISRAEMDRYAVRSHQRLAQAQDAGYLDEVDRVYAPDGTSWDADDGLRRDSSVEALGRLKPAFEKPYGRVTAGNSAQVTDGATAVLLASDRAVKDYDLPVLARLRDSQWSGVDPSEMGLGPVHASTPLLKRQRLRPERIDYWELNEAFAAQVLGCLAAWADADYCRHHLGLSKRWGELDPERVNIDGGSISLGHPVGTSGARIVLHLARILRRENVRRGVATLCIGGGQGGAMLLENPEAEA